MKNYQTIPSLNYPNQYNVENAFSLFIQQNISSARIKFMSDNVPVNTADLPYTYDILSKLLPSVLTTECFNDQCLPFAVEVRKTEIGHLFEHILLEFMCQLKISKGYRSAVFAGRTRWNWERDPRGLFHISVNCSHRDNAILIDAIEMSISLMKILLHYNQNYPYPYQTYLFSMDSLLRKKSGLKNGKKLRKSK